jgi:hypothetical protein
MISLRVHLAARLLALTHGCCCQESFLNSVVRVLFKTDPPGFFERSYPRLLEMNTWQSINQEILCVLSVSWHASCSLLQCGVAWLTMSGTCAEFPHLGASAKPFRCVFSWQHWCSPVPWWKFQSTAHVSERCAPVCHLLHLCFIHDPTTHQVNASVRSCCEIA